ncbi:MAG: GGDEF domain-containing protein [Eubacterium sp.]|nr:GGDEF domain-containing protein [Eubacterium sp.]
MGNCNKLVALCTSRIYEPQIHGYIERLNERLRKEDYSLLVFAINSDIYWEEDRLATEKYIYDLIPYKYLSAVIIMDEKIKSHKIAKKIISKSSEYKLPVIVADGKYENASCITFDYEKGFEKVVRHVIEDHNVRKPHMIAGQPDNEFSNRRIEVFKQVLKENSIEYDDSMLSYGYFWSDPCRIAMKELLKRDTLPEAIICANDNMAITVCEMLKAAGYDVPQDVIVTGFDGYDEIFFTSPKITSASCDIILLADATADSLEYVIKDKKNRNTSIVPVFIPNESCGCPSFQYHPKILNDWFKESFSRNNDDNRVIQHITSSMQTSNNPGQMVSYLESYKTENCLVAIDRKCLDNEYNYFTRNDIDGETKEFVIIYDTDHAADYKEDTFKLPESKDDYCENVLTPLLYDRIIQLTKDGYPLLFNALYYMEKPFGFICYYFRDYYISNYTYTMLITNSLSTAIGGFINLQYQTTLLNKMDEMYMHDPLTGLYNRIGFQSNFHHIIKHRKYYNQKITVIMSDLDDLKYINDNFGHAEGDVAIQTTAKALMHATSKNSLSVRFGGDELFSVIFEECDPDNIISKINAYLEEYNRNMDKPYQVNTSCGYISQILDENFDITQAVRKADEMMYAIKKSRRAK